MSSPTLPLHDQVCHSANLSTAYARYVRYRGLWSPGVPMCSVTRSPVRPMLALAEELRSGRYRPSPPTRLAIARADGGQRIITVYTLRDRVAQRAVLQVLQGRTDPAMAPGSFGFRPRRSVRQALCAARSWLDRGYAWVVDSDVERCFDTIPRRQLLDQVTRRTGDPQAAALVAEVFGWRHANELSAVGIPQGAVLAPWLCNVYLWRLDDVLNAERLPMIRYADDFVILTQSRERARQALDLCRQTVAALRLRLHPHKTRLLHALTPFRFLGQDVSATPLLEWRDEATAGAAACC